MNRVETAVETIALLLIKYGYLNDLPTVKKTWNLWSVPTTSDMVRYIENIRKLRSVLRGYSTTPNAPSVDQPFTYKTANDIEKILEDLYDMATKIPNSWYHAGDLFAGEV